MYALHTMCADSERGIIRRGAWVWPALVALGAVGCPTEEAPHSATLVVAGAGDALTLDPAAISDTESAEVATQIFEPLVRYRRGSTEVDPALATRWTVSTDGKEWLFHLREGVRFHDGTVFDADAVVFSLERQRDPHHPFHFQAFTYWESAFRNIQEVTAVDRHTVRIRIDRPFAPFLANLAMWPASIVSPTAMRRLGRSFATHPVGTGAFRLTRWEKSERIVLTRNADYWDIPPRINHLVYRVIPDASQRLTSLQSGAVDVAHGIPPAERLLINLQPDLKLYHLPGNNVVFLAMNTQRPPFDDLRVRRAINHAVNKNAIVKLVYQGLAAPASGPLPPGMWSYTNRLTTYAYDPRMARALLAEAGVSATQRFRFYVMSTPRPYLPSPVLAARMIARNLADVGVNVELVIRPFSEHLRATQTGEHDLCLAGWAGDNGDPDNFLYLLLDRDNARRGAARNQAMFSSEALHELLIRGQTEMDRSVRQVYYRRAQEIVTDQAPWVPLVHTEVVVAARRSVRDLQFHASTLFMFRWVSKD
jgi:peptide/nickel transport system substrate-binding protein